MNAVLSFIIQAKDQFSSKFEEFKSRLSSLKTSVSDAFAAAGKGDFSGISALATKAIPAIGLAIGAFRGLRATVEYLSKGLSDVSMIEGYTHRLSRLTGSLQSAKDAVNSLLSGKDAVDDLFGEEEVLRTATSLRRLSNNVLGTAADVKTLAAAAYDTGQGLSQVAGDVGGLIGMISSGAEGWERYTRSLAKSGVISFETSRKMAEMKEAGRSAGEIVATMWKEMDKDHSGAIEAARNSIDGLKKKADDSMGDMKRLLGDMIGRPFSAIWSAIKIGFSETVGFVLGGLRDAAKLTGAFVGAATSGSGMGMRGSWNFALDQIEAEKAGEKEGSGNLAEKINKTAMDDEESQKKSFEHAKKHEEERRELIQKRSAAERRFADAQRDNVERLIALEKERSEIDSDRRFSEENSDARISAETKLFEIDTNILALKKEIADAERKAAEEREKKIQRGVDLLRQETEAELNAQVERQDAQAEYELSLKTPEEKMAEVERRILQWRENLAKAESEIEKKEATDGLIEQLRARDTLKKEAADKAEALAEREGSLMERDRELRESRMTPEQRIAESRKRQSDLERQLADEADPEKRMALREKIMDETERQAGLVEKPDRKSLSLGDVFERMYGQDKPKDPAKEQVSLLKDVKLVLEKIEKKKGGMAP